MFRSTKTFHLQADTFAKIVSSQEIGKTHILEMTKMTQLQFPSDVRRFAPIAEKLSPGARLVKLIGRLRLIVTGLRQRRRRQRR